MDLVDMASQTPSYGQILSLSYPRTRYLGGSPTVVLDKSKSNRIEINGGYRQARLDKSNSNSIEINGGYRQARLDKSKSN